MPRPSQEEKILDAALHVFAARGYEGTRIRHIAEAAAVSEGALYKHYPSKEALAQAIYTRSLRAYVDRLQAIAAQEASIAERLAAIIGASLAAYRANPDAIAFILIERAQLIMSLPADVVYPIEIIHRLMQEGQQHGTIRSGDPLLLAAIFLGCFLRPIIVARAGEQHALDLLHERGHDEVITQAAWAAVAAPEQR